MWEAIRRNKRRSAVLIGVMGLLLILLGYVIGAAIFVDVAAVGRGVGQFRDYTDAIDEFSGEAPRPRGRFFSWIDDPALLLNTGGLTGAGIAVIVWIILTLIAWFEGDSVLLKTAKAVPIEKGDAPRLWNCVEEMTIASGLPKMPTVYIVDDEQPNAFAVGRKPERAAVAVTSGLLKRTNRDELQGVVAHEVGHIVNQDIRFLTLASVLLGSIVLLSDIYVRAVLRGGGGRRSSGKGGGAQVVAFVIALVFAMLAPLLARMLFFACSRRREYLADASAAQFTRFPEGLASALEKIGSSGAASAEVCRNLAPLYIVNPLQAHGRVGLFSTHPPLDERVRILRSMAGGAGFADYEAAFRGLHGGQQGCLDPAVLADQTRLRARGPSPEEAMDREGRMGREAVDALDRAADMLPLACTCGVRIKLPPDLRAPRVKCPRCGRTHDTPAAQAAWDAPKEISYQRKGTGWEAFRCACEHTVQISPAFSAPRLTCPKCGRRIRIE